MTEPAADEPVILFCRRCGYVMGECKATMLVLAGTGAAIVSKVRVKCPYCYRVLRWEPVKNDSGS